MLKDLSLKLLQLRTWCDSELLVQVLVRVAVGSEGIGLTSCTVEGEDQLNAEPLSKWFLRHEPLQLGQKLRVLTGFQRRVHSFLLGGQSEVLEPSYVERRSPFQRRIREHRATHELERLLIQPESRPVFGGSRLRHPALKLLDVQGVTIATREGIPARCCRDPPWAKDAPQFRDVDTNEMLCARGSSVAPHAVDQSTRGHRRPSLEDKYAQNRAGTSARKLHSPTIDAHLERPERQEDEARHVGESIAADLYLR